MQMHFQNLHPNVFQNYHPCLILVSKILRVNAYWDSFISSWFFLNQTLGSLTPDNATADNPKPQCQPTVYHQLLFFFGSSNGVGPQPKVQGTPVLYMHAVAHPKIFFSYGGLLKNVYGSLHLIITRM